MEVAVFSADDCAGCKVVKNMLTEKGVVFEVKDIMNSDVMEEAQQLGIRGIPVTVFYEGGVVKDSIVGSTEQALKRILEIIG